MMERTGYNPSEAARRAQLDRKQFRILFRKQYVALRMKKANDNKTLAASDCGMDRKHLTRLCKKYCI